MASISRESKPERVFRKNGGEGSVLPPFVSITPQGRALVERDPNLSEPTMEKLLKTDGPLLSDRQRRLAGAGAAEIARKGFYEEESIGLLHLAQCVEEDRSQTLGELVAAYAMERHIPYLLAAVMVRSLMREKELFYIRFSEENGMRRIRWRPVKAYIPPLPESPPEKKTVCRRRPKTPDAGSFRLADCPLCGSRARLCRCGRGSLLWHVCCSDPEGKCPFYTGTRGEKTLRRAAQRWNAGAPVPGAC